MFKLFFKNQTVVKNISNSRMFSTFHKEFGLVNSSRQNGKIVKVLLSEKDKLQDSREKIYKDIILPHKNCLFIGTTPTVHYKQDYLQSIYPGHNFSFMTDNNGSVTASVSKRPDTSKPLALYKRIPDGRLSNLPSSVRLYAPLYTSLPEDLLKWLERANRVSSYPLYLHIFPITPKLAIDVHQYKTNINYLLQDKHPYSLFSWVHPEGERFIRASNCNSDVQKAIFGLDLHEVQDMFCQEAAMTMALQFAKPEEYQKAVELLGFNQGIEKSPLTSDSYLPAFTA
ncbi:hypothetical protein [Legionella brunensis]|uniref:Uncharacterized protein n=1 Tax=Legionella brunensis TaxID=29422 RepID=A0A0W0S102_9GAMM|nr:hypothetical protein [Legionella brunensis]KTC77106.1 hypothetical protein Lbru_3213 [Legionella brunensis]